MKRFIKRGIFLFSFFFLFQISTALIPTDNQDLLSKLGQHQNYKSKRISSFDRTGGNRDRLTLKNVRLYSGKNTIILQVKGKSPDSAGMESASG